MNPDSDDLRITGTLIWYAHCCTREVWLMAHQLNPDEDDPNMDLGRFIHAHAYPRYKKREIRIGSISLDILREDRGVPVVGEVKKSSRYLKSSRMQLAFYLLELKQRGIAAKGEILIPQEKKTVAVDLTPEIEDEVTATIEQIRQIAAQDNPPPAHRIGLCEKCAYQEFCWS